MSKSSIVFKMPSYFVRLDICKVDYSDWNETPCDGHSE